jgi:hypothetical protein
MPVVDYLWFCADLQGLANKKLRRSGSWFASAGSIRKTKRSENFQKDFDSVGLAHMMIHDPKI